MSEGNAALRKRGLLLFGLIAVIAAVVLLALARWPSQQTPQEPPEGVTPSPAGWEIRYQATVTLARRGSKQVPLATLREMLDEKQQLRNCVTKLQNGKVVSDEGAARRIIISALNAFVEWKQKVKDEGELGTLVASSGIYEAIDKLRETPNLQLRTEVEKAREALGRKT